MKAKVIQKCRGVRAGKVYPDDLVPGDVVEGSLAAALISMGTAVELRAEGGAPKNMSKGSAPQNMSKGAAPENKAAGQSAGTFPADTPAEPVARKGGGNRGRRAKPKKG